MHIPSYQIRNVLNVYRKQLSQGTGSVARANPSATPHARDRINISSDGQRQSIMDRISSEIVDRIAQFGPETQFDDVLQDELSRTTAGGEKPGSQENVEFSYTLIDEHNRKVTNKLPIRKLGPVAPQSGTATGPEMDDKFTLDDE